MTNVILILVLAVIVISAAMYVYKAKKRGVKCVGCSAGSSCGSCRSGGSCSCDSGADTGASCCCGKED